MTAFIASDKRGYPRNFCPISRKKFVVVTHQKCLSDLCLIITHNIDFCHTCISIGDLVMQVSVCSLIPSFLNVLTATLAMPPSPNCKPLQLVSLQ